MKRTLTRIIALAAVLVLAFTFFAGMTCFAEGEDVAEAVTEAAEEQGSGMSSKAIAATVCITVVAAIGAISMGFAISKATDGISRQPESDSKIRTTLMLGLVFIETAIIYALIVAILIIFVL